MPKIKIKRGSSLSGTLESGELALNTTTQHLYAGDSDSGTSIENADNVSVKYAEKIGHDKGTPAQIGSATKPVYVASDGTVTPSNANVGSDDSDDDYLVPIYMSGGTLLAASRTRGDATTPVYVNAGKITAGNKYAGGTNVTLNGTSYGSGDASIYAPTTAPTGVQGTRLAMCTVGGTPQWTTGSAGASNKPMYLYNGRLLTGDLYAGGTKVTLNGSPKGGSDASFYAPESLGSEASVLATRSSGLQWVDCPFTNSVYSVDSGTVWDTTISNVTRGIYAVLAYESSLGEYYTFYVIVHQMNVGNKYVSTSYTTQPSSGFTPSCCVVATVESSTSVNFKVTENSGNRDWYFRRIYKVNNIA